MTNVFMKELNKRYLLRHLECGFDFKTWFAYSSQRAWVILSWKEAGLIMQLCDDVAAIAQRQCLEQFSTEPSPLEFHWHWTLWSVRNDLIKQLWVITRAQCQVLTGQALHRLLSSLEAFNPGRTLWKQQEEF